MYVGISVPEKRAGATDEQGKKKVMYGARQRKNKKKQDENSSHAQSLETADTHEDSSTAKPSEAELEVWELYSKVHSIILYPYIRRTSLIVGMMRRKRKVEGQRLTRENMSKPTGMMKVRKKRRLSPARQLNQPAQWRVAIGSQSQARERQRRRRRKGKRAAAVAATVKKTRVSQKRTYLHLRRSREGFK